MDDLAFIQKLGALVSENTENNDVPPDPNQDLKLLAALESLLESQNFAVGDLVEKRPNVNYKYPLKGHHGVICEILEKPLPRRETSDHYLCENVVVGVFVQGQFVRFAMDPLLLVKVND